ncbi:MAG: hypothetical protein EP343_13255 [Deltaproteobacteria bacterium]|nr:MAG: hypothetical protein EP343_13255 [Deltaproteobacteria bacterium]
MSEHGNDMGDGVHIAEGSWVRNSQLAYVEVGPGCSISHCQIVGLPGRPVRIESNVTLWDCVIRNTSKEKSFSFGPWRVASSASVVGEGSSFSQSHIEDSTIGKHVTGIRCVVRASEIGDKSEVRPHGNLILTKAAPHCNLGSEISKSILEGQGFVSEHTGSYLSLVAPSRYPLVNEEGEEVLSPALPNLTNIGAGTVFANYSGKPKPAASLSESSGSLKGTSLGWGAFTGVNSVIVNRYEQPQADESIFSILRNRDVTSLGFGCLVEKKVTGRIPAFSYASSTSARSIQIGWVLEHQPGIVHNILLKMRKRLGAQASDLQGLVEGTLRLEIRLLEEQLEHPSSFFTKEQLIQGIERYRQHLDGRWRLNESGELTHPWRFDHEARRWTP